jgi:hypothetical protein
MNAFSHRSFWRAICAAAIAAPPAIAASTAPAGAEQQDAGAQTICRTFRPAEAMTTSLGSKSALAYFVSKDGVCQVAVLVSEKFDPEREPPRNAARLNLSLQSGEAMSLDSEVGETLKIACGRAAAFVKVTTGPREIVASTGEKDGPMLCSFDARR